MVKMIAFLLLVSAAYPAISNPAAQAQSPSARFIPSSKVSARATASVRIVKGIRYGSEHPDKAPGATLRSAILNGSDGQAYPAKLLEFQ
jgi:hypothetical protein